MWYRIGADLVVLLHLAFVLFVVTGALLLLKWPRLVAASAGGGLGSHCRVHRLDLPPHPD